MARPVDTPEPPDDAAMLARLRVAVETGTLPRDLGEWAVAKLTPAAERRAARDAALQAAARRLPGISPWHRARALERELRRAGKADIAGHGEDGPYGPSVRFYVDAARRLDPAVRRRSRLTLLRALRGRR